MNKVKGVVVELWGRDHDGNSLAAPSSVFVEPCHNAEWCVGISQEGATIIVSIDELKEALLRVKQR